MTEEKKFSSDESERLNAYLEKEISNYRKERNEEINNKAEIYKEAFNKEKEIKDFSWVLDADKKVLKLGRNSKDVNSIKWGIPNMVIGNPESADFYLCLLNPRVEDATKSVKNVQEYILKETGKISKDEITEEKKNSQNYLRNEFYFDVDDYKKHIDNYDERKSENVSNVLSNEMKNLQEIIKDDKNEYTDFQSWHDAYTKKYEELSDNKKNKYKKNNPFLQAYYLHSYYNFLFRSQFSGGNELAVFNGLYDKQMNESSKIKSLKICDLELFPYRTESKPSDTLFKKGKSYKDLKSSQYVADLIIKRILDYNKKEPIFVFRSYREWFKVIEYELAKGLGCIEDGGELTREEELELLKKYDTKLWPCFYGFSSVQSGSLSKNNVEKAPLIGVDIEEKNMRISKTSSN
ncbi:hypothetical protein [Companilactobacillus farciminis]|uniref:hypothetical protein n=1 Tax=Companilactobacillus farciminis TaxID=1612 RepID=UPI00232E6DDF|nr:hypothetical protein [Companilactobacillus farciminis]WCG35917.1 hypothetical protein PML84_01685 [Companilactobacillus farciminis]